MNFMLKYLLNFIHLAVLCATKRLPSEPFMPQSRSPDNATLVNFINYKYQNFNQWPYRSKDLLVGKLYYSTQHLMNQFKSSHLSPLQVGLDFIKIYLSACPCSSYILKDHYQTDFNRLTHIYVRQTVHDFEVINANMNVNVAENGEVISFGHDLYFGRTCPLVTEIESGISAIEAFEVFYNQLKLIDAASSMPTLFTTFANDVAEISADISSPLIDTNFTRKPVSAVKVLMKLDTERLTPAWNFEVEMEENWFNAFVSSVDGSLLGYTDWVTEFSSSSKAIQRFPKKIFDYHPILEPLELPLSHQRGQSSYLVFPLGTNDPIDGSAAVRTGPASLRASPQGWHYLHLNQTAGNNVIAQENHDVYSDWEANYRPSGGQDLTFHYHLDPMKDPKLSVNASVTNLFYWNNLLHDIFYEYGFDEKAGNFQNENFDRGGLGKDHVIAHAQDGSGTNNANFATPPDGSPGRMRMYLWTRTTPWRDGDFENSIIIHEASHGLTTRLTGGPSNSNCLSYGESGGMGEGWGDILALLFRQRPSYTRHDSFEIGTYSNDLGIRNFPYSTSFFINPVTYSFIRKQGYEGVHAKGEVWAEVLFEAYWNIIDDHAAFSTDWLHGDGGNNIFLRNLIDAMKLQPCLPSFLEGRDSILLADRINFEGLHTCSYWKAFSKRGLGLYAKRGGYNDFTMPPECEPLGHKMH